MLIGVFLCQEFAYSSDVSYLRIPSIFNFQDLKKENTVSQKKTGLSPAVLAFRVMNHLFDMQIKENISIMITPRCQYDCAFCVTAHLRKNKKMKDMPKETLFNIADQVRGIKQITFVGPGESTNYGKGKKSLGGITQDFIDVVNYFAERVGELWIDTNGYPIPEDEGAAIFFFQQFPKNVRWVLSVDGYHEREMMDRQKKSLKKVISIMESLSEGPFKLKTAYNLATTDKHSVVLDRFGLMRKHKSDPEHVAIFDVVSQGAAADNKIVGAQARSSTHLKYHATIVGAADFYINLYGDVVASHHVAFLLHEEREGLSSLNILGNVHNSSLSSIFLEGYLS